MRQIVGFMESSGLALLGQTPAAVMLPRLTICLQGWSRTCECKSLRHNSGRRMLAPLIALDPHLEYDVVHIISGRT